MFRCGGNTPRPQPGRNPAGIDAAANALRVIRLLQDRGSITVTEVSREVGVGKSTAHRLLSTLVAEEFAVWDPIHRNYHAGKVIVDAGLSLLGHFDVRQRANAPMNALARRTGETIKVVVLEGSYTRAIHVVESLQNLRTSGRVGEILHAHASAGGKLLLINDSPERLRERLGNQLTALTTSTITDGDRLIVELGTIRGRRWASSVEESTDGITGLAVPILGHGDQMFAALAIAAPPSGCRKPASRRCSG